MAGKTRIAAALTALLLAAGTLLGAWQVLRTPPPAPPELKPWQMLGAVEGFKRPAFPRDFDFPADHAAHRGYRTEWWHLTGSLEDPAGQRLGVQLTLLRLGLDPDDPERPSRWAASDVYAGVFLLSGKGRGAHARQRMARGALGLAGATPEPLRVWVEDWSLEQAGDRAPLEGLVVRAHGPAGHLRLELDAAEPVVESAMDGWNPGQAPPYHYYLYPRLRAAGSLVDGDRETPLAGSVSLEHAWGELPLPGGPVAIDRFTLYLADGRTLLLNRTHRVDGSGTPRATGVLVAADGRARLLGRDEVELRPTAHRAGGLSGARYPVGWSLRLPDHGVEGAISPRGGDHEVAAWLRYWGGPVALRAPSAPRRAAGHGFMQLTGYGE